MTTNWIDLDPGAGDTAACGPAKSWTDAQSTDLIDARTAVERILRDLDESWTGESASAFRTRMERFRTRLDDSAQAMETAGRAIIAYGDTVADIARRAEPLKSDLEAAEAILNGILDYVTFDRYTTQGAGGRFIAEQKARADAEAAAMSLRALAAERRQADLVLARALASAASVAWDDLDASADPITGTRRDAAKDRVMDLFEHFRTGDERGAVLMDDDIFVQTLMKSDHIAAVRNQVLDDLRSGALDVDTPGHFNRVISNNLGVLFADAMAISSSPMTGTIPDELLGGQNLPQTFLGSYILEVRAGEPRSDGGVEVTYVIDNDTSIDSATRIPGTGGAHVPGAFEAMTDANANNGEWATHHQTIVWTETVYP